jgi:hypothetical protein
MKRIDVARNTNDKLEVFVLGSDNKVYSKAQQTAGSTTDWTSWADRGGPGVTVKKIVAAQNNSGPDAGKLRLFALGDSGVYTTKQQQAGGNTWEAWSAMGNPADPGQPPPPPPPPGGLRSAEEGEDDLAGDLSPSDLQPIVREAIARWTSAAGGPTLASPLSRMSVRVADLPPSYLGLAAADGISIDRNAAGHGWFVDPTPGDDAEFAPWDVRGLRAPSGGPASGRMDLLTVVMHEMGHALGLGHTHESGLMAELLMTGVRRLPGAAEHEPLPELIPPAGPAPSPLPPARGSGFADAGSFLSEPAPSAGVPLPGAAAAVEPTDPGLLLALLAAGPLAIVGVAPSAVGAAGSSRPAPGSNLSLGGSGDETASAGPGHDAVPTVARASLGGDEGAVPLNDLALAALLDRGQEPWRLDRPSAWWIA